jgi:hypothetical protein
MKKLYFISIIIILLSFNIIYSQTITSTTSGGQWSSTDTWIGGVIPGDINDVIINGPVDMDWSRTVKNLTINSSKVLRNFNNYTPDLVVTGTLTINGSLVNNSAGGYIDLYASGNVVINGTITTTYMTFSGNSGTQQLSGSGIYNAFNIYINPNRQVHAAGNLMFGENVIFDIWGDTLNMGSHKLTSVNVDRGFRGSGRIYSNGEIDVTGLFQANLDGNYTLTGDGIMKINTFTSYSNFTVAAGKIIENYINWLPDLVIHGDIINYGTIRNNPIDGGYIDLYANANVINEGELTVSYMTLSGNSGTQHLGGSAEYNAHNIYVNPNREVHASSNLKIGESVNFDLYGDTLNMGTYKLTNVSVDRGFTGSGRIFSNGEIDITGKFQTNLDGNYTLVGDGVMKINTFSSYGNFTVGEGKIVQNYSNWIPDLYVHGDIINYGIIRNNPDDGGYIDLYASSNIINEGELSVSYLSLNGNSGTQQLSGSAEFNPYNIYINPNREIHAASDLLFGGNVIFDLWGDTVNMGTYKLTNVNVDRGFRGDGKIYSDGEIDVTGFFQTNLDGNYTLVGEGIMSINTLSSYSDFRVGEGKIVQNYSNWIPDLYVHGDVINNGIIRNNPVNGGYIDFYSYGGSIFNYGEMAPAYLTHYAYGKTPQISGEVTSNYYFTMLNYGRTEIRGGVNLNITEGAYCGLSGAIWRDGSSVINNEGDYYRFYNVTYNTTIYPDEAHFMGMRVTDRNTMDTLHVTLHNNQSYPNLSSSVKRWWQLEGNNPIGSYVLTLHYDDDLLNGQNEDNMDVFLTTDEGSNWTILSNPINTVIDKDANTITIGSPEDPVTAGLGDIVISSDEVVPVPSISLSISGREQIRVGPPNLYTVTYWNNDDYYTDQAVIELTTDNGVHIMGIVTTEIETGEKVEYPIDSLTYDGVNDEVFLVTEPLAPGEVRSFDLILGAVPGAAKLTDGGITLGVAVYWVVGTVVKKYVTDTMVQGCYEMWRPVSMNESGMTTTRRLVENSFNNSKTFENTGKNLAQSAGEEILEKTAGVAVWPLGLAKDIFDCMGNTFKGMKDYVNGNFDKKGKDLEKVTSWDPNEKEGPTGDGGEGFMATSAPMAYTIFFENKKEAQAPAWKVVIVDTLDESVFDVSTVEVGDMSHDMGVFTQEGNILRWEFVEIELQPNVEPPEGEGWVKFTVHPIEGLPTGTQLKNKAEIVFDLNDPIMTNEYVNILDFDPPVTTPVSLTQYGTDLKLTWTGDDAGGSGIKKSMVYMASGEGPFSMVNVCDSSSIIIEDIEIDKLYKFYVLSEDQVGNAETDYSQIIDIVTDVDEAVVIPDEYKLTQNYPNPFNPSTTIEYWIPKLSDVRLDIYNIIGQKVMTVVNEVHSPGVYRYSIDMSGFATGVYIYELRVDNAAINKKMLLVK